MADLGRYDVIDGFEYGPIDDTFASPPGINFSATGAAITAAAARSGSYGLRLNPSGALAGVDWGGTAADKIIRLYFRFNDLPNSDCYLFYVGQVSGGAHYRGLAWNNSTNSIRPFGFTTTSGNTYGTDGFQPIENIWYRLDLNVHTAIDWQVDGVVQPSFTPTLVGGGALGVPILGNANSVNTTMSLDIDDVICAWHSAGGQRPTYPIGPGKVVLIRPDSDGTHSGAGDFTDSNSNSPPAANAYQLIDDDPITDTASGDYFRQTSANTNSYLEFNFSNLPADALGVNGYRPWIGAAKDNDGISLFTSLRSHQFIKTTETDNEISRSSTAKAYTAGTTVQDDITIDDINNFKYRIGYDPLTGSSRGSKTRLLDIFVSVDIQYLDETPEPAETTYYQPGTTQAFTDAKMNTGFEHGSLSTGEYTLGQGTFKEISGAVELDTETVRDNSTYSLKISTRNDDTPSANRVAGTWVYAQANSPVLLDSVRNAIDAGLTTSGVIGFGAKIPWSTLEAGRWITSGASAGATQIPITQANASIAPPATLVFYGGAGMTEPVEVNVTFFSSSGSGVIHCEPLSADIGAGARAGKYVDDFLLDDCFEIARLRGKKFKIGVLAGSWTPHWVIDDGSYFYTSDGVEYPRPFGPGGATNTEFEFAWEGLVRHLFDWAREKNDEAGFNIVPLIDLCWYSGIGNRMDLYFGTGVSDAFGDSLATNESRMTVAHKRLVDIAYPLTGNDVAASFAVSGVGPVYSSITGNITQHIVDTAGSNSTRVYARSTQWSPDGNWSDVALEESQYNNAVFNKNVLVGQQDTVGPTARTSQDWTDMFNLLTDRTKPAIYCEVHANEFTVKDNVQTTEGLATMKSEISNFFPEESVTSSASYAIINAADEKDTRLDFTFFDPPGDPWGILAGRLAITKPAGAVTITAPQNPQNVIDSHPAGTTYWFDGVFKLGAAIKPKNGDTLITNNAVLDGQLKFLSGNRLDPNAVITGTEIGIDLKKNEVSNSNSATGVMVKGFIIRNFVDIGLRPWIGCRASYLLIYNCVGNGVGVGFENKPWQGGNSRQFIFTDSVIWDNGSHASTGHSSGGMKLARTGTGSNWKTGGTGSTIKASQANAGAEIRRVYAWRNIGNGLWFDVTCGGDLVNDCIADENSRKGIFYEVSVGPCEFSDNTARNNATWLGEAPRPASDYGINVHTSLHVKVLRNRVSGNGDNNGIKIEEQGDRFDSRGHGTDDIEIRDNNLLDNDALVIDPEASNVISTNNNNKGAGVNGASTDVSFDPNSIDDPPPSGGGGGGGGTFTNAYNITALLEQDTPPGDPGDPGGGGGGTVVLDGANSSFRFYVNLANVSGSASRPIFSLGDHAAIAANQVQFNLSVNPVNQKFEMDGWVSNSAGVYNYASVSSINTYVLNQWHLIEILIQTTDKHARDDSDHPWYEAWLRVDNVDQGVISLTRPLTGTLSDSLGGTESEIVFGSISSASTTEYIAYYDDFIWYGTKWDENNENRAIWPIGGGQTLVMYVDDLGTTNNPGHFQNNDGTAINFTTPDRLDERPILPSTDGAEQITANTSSYVGVSMSDLATNSIIYAGTIQAAFHAIIANSAVATTFGLKAISGAAELVSDYTFSSVADTDANGVTNSTDRSVWVPLDLTQGSTVSVLNNLELRFGYAATVTNTPHFEAFIIEIDGFPGDIPPPPPPPPPPDEDDEEVEDAQRGAKFRRIDWFPFEELRVKKLDDMSGNELYLFNKKLEARIHSIQPGIVRTLNVPANLTNNIVFYAEYRDITTNSKDANESQFEKTIRLPSGMFAGGVMPITFSNIGVYRGKAIKRVNSVVKNPKPGEFIAHVDTLANNNFEEDMDYFLNIFAIGPSVIEAAITQNFEDVTWGTASAPEEITDTKINQMAINGEYLNKKKVQGFMLNMDSITKTPDDLIIYLNDNIALYAKYDEFKFDGVRSNRNDDDKQGHSDDTDDETPNVFTRQINLPKYLFNPRTQPVIIYSAGPKLATDSEPIRKISSILKNVKSRSFTVQFKEHSQTSNFTQGEVYFISFVAIGEVAKFQ